MKSGKEIKKEICSLLKLKPKSISVNINRFSMSNSIDIVVKTIYPLSLVKEIAVKYEKIYYCKATGECLGGGNTFVDVRYERNLNFTEDFINIITKNSDVVFEKKPTNIEIFCTRIDTLVANLKTKEAFKFYTDADLRLIFKRNERQTENILNLERIK